MSLSLSSSSRMMIACAQLSKAYAKRMQTHIIVMLIFHALISYHLYMLSLNERETLNMELYYYPMHLGLNKLL